MLDAIGREIDLLVRGDDHHAATTQMRLYLLGQVARGRCIE
jgi:hypothetical protein